MCAILHTIDSCARYHLAVPSPGDDHVRILVLGTKTVDFAVLGHVTDLGKTSTSASKGERKGASTVVRFHIRV